MIYGEFANVVITYGSKGMMSEPEILGSAFFRDTRVRKLKHKSYHFLDVEIEQLDPRDDESICIMGRFVKNTRLERDQYLKSGRLIEDHESMESAPSSLFFLFPARHRLVFAPETKFAPSLSEFRSTLRFFLVNAWKEKLRRFYDEVNSEKRVMTWEKLEEQHPKPIVHMVHQASPASIAQFVKRFKKINRMTITVIERNAEWSRKKALGALPEAVAPAKPDGAKVVLTGGADGLNKKGTEKVATSATKAGYEEVQLTGTDTDGAKLSGANEDFKYRVPLGSETGASKLKTYAASAFVRLSEAIKSKVVSTNFSANELADNIQASKTLLQERDDAGG